MISTRPGILAVRAVNEYRRRDVFAYMALRYYLANSASRSDEWAKRVATELVLTRKTLPYFPAHHFKEIPSEDKIEHRPMFIPAANETIAEAALLDQCAKNSVVFGNPSCVYSYSLVERDSRTGIFDHYMNGIRARHTAIDNACKQFPNGIVRFTDIQKFYPSVGVERARTAWLYHCDQSNFAVPFRKLGEKLIEDHGNASGQSSAALLTGPMFSHLLANLVLRKFDLAFSRQASVRYFRYVDDITLVGDPNDVKDCLAKVRDDLGSLGFSLHPDNSPKCMEVSCTEWSKSRDDFADDRRPISWLRLISDLKQYLLIHPTKKHEVQNAFRDEGLRIPVRDYSAIAYEVSYVEKILKLFPFRWFRRRTQGISIRKLVAHAKNLRDRSETEFRELFQQAEKGSLFDVKRRIPRLRYCMGRLIYLASDSSLSSIGEIARNIPALQFHSHVMMTVADGNLDRVLPMGTNAAQATAQPMRAAGRSGRITKRSLSKVEEQSLAVFLMNGILVNGASSTNHGDSELMRFARFGADRQLMRSQNSFLREVACLHGLSEKPRHPEMFDLAFDEDEIMAMDAVEQFQQSLSP